MIRFVLVTMAIVLPAQAVFAGKTANVVPTSRPPTDQAVAYVASQPVPPNPVQMTETLSAGQTIPENLLLLPIPDSPHCAFLFVNQVRLIVDARTRVVIQIVD
ncbi:DUF1236 domain-containing protein [Rhizobium sp. SL86]|uniref:DUF1236 domain-containing protein n=1 Tax=Rhizobium sp. SL86 TaxID=2995148 RepID=UPI002275CC0A|nr:DUF1236 domain-containing protein [Rhizobium sp. SL86]MCY1667696.1 DUF1236 domain-containing protein [Rhizobium sp. SL86]